MTTDDIEVLARRMVAMLCVMAPYMTPMNYVQVCYAMERYCFTLVDAELKLQKRGDGA